MPKKREEDIGFEEAIVKLEESVRALEKGDLTLEDSLKTFEEGIKWSKSCEEKLSEAKGKVEKLIEKAGGKIGVEDFETE